MPKKQRMFSPHDYETYNAYLNRVQEEVGEEYDPSSKAATLMATSFLISVNGGGNKIASRVKILRGRKQLMNHPAFKMMEKDGTIKEMVKKNLSPEELIRTWQVNEQKYQDQLAQKYGRPADEQILESDNQLLKSALESLNKKGETLPTTGSPEIEFRGKQFKEMVKQLEYAQTLAENGVQLDPEQTKKLIETVQQYNDGSKKGTKSGGEKQAEGFTEVMTVLQNYMPAADFRRYCGRVNENRGIADPEHPDFAAPESFAPERLGGSKTVKELMAEAHEAMRNNFGSDTVARAVAIQQLSGGNPNKLLRPEEIDLQASKLNAPGSAFSRVMQDEKAMENLGHLAAMGERVEVMSDLGKELEKQTREIDREAKERVVWAAQGQINRSIRTLTGGTPLNRYFTEQYLANILASEQVGMNPQGDEKLTNKGFRERAEKLQEDPAFQRLAQRYMNDPSFRKQVNDGLLADRSAGALAQELQNERKPQRRPGRDAGEQQPVQEQEQRAQEQEQRVLEPENLQLNAQEPQHVPVIGGP